MKNTPLLKTRAAIIRAIRDFFHAEDFVETDTPTLVFSPGMEPHIQPIGVKKSDSFLQTSPEFAMKRILADHAANGLDKIFQICKSYRLEPKSTTHQPEFTMIEWYRTESGYEAIMDDVEKLFRHVVKTVKEIPSSVRTAVDGTWLRMSVEEAFRNFAKIELTEYSDVKKFAELCHQRGHCTKHLLTAENLVKPAAWDDFFFLIMLNEVEPKISALNKPVIIYDYPESQAALANIKTDSRGFKWGKRFEVYAGGFELGNAFDELCDAKIQRARFEKDMQVRKELYSDSMPVSPIDEDFLKALEKMPKSGGIAMGVDRMVMYFTKTENLSEVLWQEPIF